MQLGDEQPVLSVLEVVAQRVDYEAADGSAERQDGARSEDPKLRF